MRSVAVVGAKGYVGSALTEAFARAGRFLFTAVTRENYDEMRQGSYDILVNAAMPAARFWAKNNPEKDYVETVEKTRNLLGGWKFKKFVQISTVSARCQLDTVYGQHKLAAEKLIDAKKHLIVRLGSMYSQDLSKGVLVDMMEGKKVFMDGESRYCFAPLDFVARWIVANVDRRGIVEVGAKNSIALKDIAAHLGKKIEFEGALDHQEIPDPEPGFPDARDVLAFLDNWKRA